MTASYANDKLLAVIEMFALSQDSLQGKLASAFAGELFKLSESCFPPYLLPQWKSVINRLRDAADVSQPRPAMNLSDAAAQEMVRHIYLLSTRLQRFVNVDDYILHGNREG